MASEITIPAARRPFPIAIAAAVLLAGVLVVTSSGSLWQLWRSDSSLSHAPLVPLIAAGLIWSRRAELRSWQAADNGGLTLLAVAAILHVAAIWADIAFLIPLSLILMLAGGIWFLGGARALGASAGAIGFLVFLIPWPTTVVERLSFPLQLMSSSYAAMLSGLLGIPVVRSGVELAVMPNPAGKPVYSILVAQKCSGLTSLTVLLALGYLVAFFTPLKWRWRALLLLAVVPMALLANAVRLTAVLAAGGYHSAELAKWIHDNEGPVLILFCSMGLMGIRQALMTWTRAGGPSGDSRSEDGSALPVVGG